MNASGNELEFLASLHPFDLLPHTELQKLVNSLERISTKANEILFDVGDKIEHLHLVGSGIVEIKSPEKITVSQILAGETFGARTLLRNVKSTHMAVCSESGFQYLIPASIFKNTISKHAGFAAYFGQTLDSDRIELETANDSINALITAKISEFMTKEPVSVGSKESIKYAAHIMKKNSISCVLVCEENRLLGILTSGDVTSRVVASGVDIDMPVSKVMTSNPVTLSSEAIFSEAMVAMSSRNIGHLPVVDGETPVGIITRSDFVKRTSVSPVQMISDLWRLEEPEALAGVISNLPILLAQLVGSGVDAYRVGLVITSVTDALTKRFLQLAERKLGEAPIPYLWLACGSQGRQEQTGVSDQDNCVMLDDRFNEKEHGRYFNELTKFVSDGLNVCGYVYCPGEMMATNPKWCQPVRVWRKYFQDWIQHPNPMAQMLASVMFDLRPISGDFSLFGGIQTDTLNHAGANSIFQAHMTSNSLKHTPPLGLFRGFALIRSGEHKDTLDLKHSGTVPIVDIARLYAIRAGVESVNTRDRLKRAQSFGVLSEDGAKDLIDAYDLISDIRIEHQARLVKDGKKPDNFVKPSSLSALERNYLKNAFSVIKTIQSALNYKSIH